MIIGQGLHTYEWQEQWAKLPDNPTTHENGRTHGVVITQAGDVVVFAQANPAVLIYDQQGKLKNAWGDRFPGAHGMTLVREAGAEYLWLTDQYSGEVAKATLDGRTVQTIPRPAIEEPYSPTWVAVNPANDDIWVADGYGSNRVRGYDKAGKYLGEISGEEGPERFARPHGIAFSPEGELYVTDRQNKRILVYDGDGVYLRHRDQITHSPCGFAFHDGLTYVPELFGSVKLLDRDLNLVAELGSNADVRPSGGWPDQKGWGWPVLPGWPDLAGTEHIHSGRFNSPHALAVGSNGDIFVVEWIIGGRMTRLRRK